MFATRHLLSSCSFLLTQMAVATGAPVAMGAIDAPLRPSISVEAPAPFQSCAGQAGLYAAGGLKLWVSRRGTVEQENPLRPLSRDRLLVLQVSVNGRLATAFGPDFDNLRQGASTQKLEELMGHPVRWAAEDAELPGAIRIVAEDGRVLLGPLAFQSCGAAPRSVAPPASRPSAAGKSGPSAGVRPPPPVAPPGLSLPQGAIP